MCDLSVWQDLGSTIKSEAACMVISTVVEKCTVVGFIISFQFYTRNQGIIPWLLYCIGLRKIQMNIGNTYKLHKIAREDYVLYCIMYVKKVKAFFLQNNKL